MLYLIHKKEMWGGADTVSVLLQARRPISGNPVQSDDSQGYQFEGSVTLRGKGVHRTAILQLLDGKDVGEEVEIAGFDIFGSPAP
jgi:hypothetical protein